MTSLLPDVVSSVSRLRLLSFSNQLSIPPSTTFSPDSSPAFMCTADTGGTQKCAICGGSSPLTSNQSVEDPDSSLVNEPSETTNNYDSDLESESADQKERTSSSNESSSLSSSSCHGCSGSNYSDTNPVTKDEDRDSGPPDLAKGKGTKGETQYGWGGRNGKIDVIDKFHEKYFQRVKKRELRSSSRRKDWKAIVNDIKNSNEEATMYLHLAKLLTRVCIDACKTRMFHFFRC